jgi:hypothetical protein
MELHEQQKTGVVVEQALGSEVDGQLSRLQTIGNNALRYARNVLAVGSIMTVASGMAPLPGETETVAQAGPFQEGALAATPHHGGRTRHKPPAYRRAHSQTAEQRCTWITDFPSGYYEGEACGNDKLTKLRTSAKGRFDYGSLLVGGVYKCGWVKEGFVPTREAHKISGNLKACQKAYKTMSNPHTFLEAINCKPGSCQDGTFRTPLTNECDHKFYQNFATAAKSVLNVQPTGKSGFSDYVGEQFGSVHYRATIKAGSKAGDAIMVRSDKLGWGMMIASCAPPQAGAVSH